jgi:hypothetical protein
MTVLDSSIVKCTNALWSDLDLCCYAQFDKLVQNGEPCLSLSLALLAP